MWSDPWGGSLPGHRRVDGLEVEAERPAPAPLVHVADVAGRVGVSGARAPGQTEASVLQKPIVGHPELGVSLGTQGLVNLRHLLPQVPFDGLEILRGQIVEAVHVLKTSHRFHTHLLNLLLKR